MANEFLTIGIFGAVVCFVVLRIMAMLYVGSKPDDDYIARAGHDMQTDMEYGSNRAQFMFDPKMTAFWARKNGWLVLWVMRAGLVCFFAMAVVGFAMFAV